MNVREIDQNLWSVFEPLFLPIVKKALNNGDAVALLGLEEENVACGAAAYYVEGTRLEIISFYVAPAYRNQGGGSYLLATIAQIARRSGISEIALDFSSTNEEHFQFIHFLEEMGYERRFSMNGNHYYMTLEQMLASPYNKPTKSLIKDVVSFRQLDEYALHRMYRLAQEDDIFLPVKTLSDPEVEADVSCAFMKNGVPIGFLLFLQEEARLTLRNTWDGEHKIGRLPKMLLYALEQLKGKYPPQTPMAVYAMNGSCEKLVMKLVPEARPISVCYYYTLDEGSK